MAKRKNKKRKKPASTKSSTAHHSASTPAVASEAIRPRFTVAMATYNRAHWVADSIQSVLSQSFVDFEYVIVDDGSTDDTAVVINAIDDPRIKYIQKDVNEGRPATRNRVVAESCGEYILWMADDDRLAPGILARYDLALRNDPTIDVIYGNLAVFSESADAVESTYEPTDWVSNPRGFIGAKLSGSMLPDPGTATRLEIVQSLDYVYDLEFLRAQDYELWTRIAHVIKIHKVNEAVYFYRQHEESASFGDFVDTTYESKIIRAHRARHSAEVLAPDLDWRHQGIANARLNLRIATALNQYRDGVNALRFCAAIPNWYNEPMVLKEAITALCIQGHTQEALDLIDTALLNVPKLHDDFELLRSNVQQLERFKTQISEEVAQLDESALVESIRRIHGLWGWTYDLARVFGQMKQNLGQLKSAALAYAYAARLNLDDTVCVSALEHLTPHVSLAPGKLDVVSMRRRISESYVEIGADQAQKTSTAAAVLTILDLHNQSPDTLLEMLAQQDVKRFEVVGFYGEGVGSKAVTSVEKPDGFRAQLKRLLNAVSGDWFVFAEPSMHLYQDWVSSILNHCSAAVGAIQCLAMHVPDPTDQQSILSFNPPPAMRSVYGGIAQPMHRFAFSQLLREDSEFWTFLDQVFDADGFRLYLSRAALSAPQQSAHVGATAYLAHAVPDVPVTLLPEFYREHQRKTLFDREIRSLQNECLESSKLHFLETGRVTIALFTANDIESTIRALTAARVHTFAPSKLVVFGNTPSEPFRGALRSFRDEYSDLAAVLNSAAVVGPKLLNQALCRIGSDAIVFLDPSVRLTREWLARLLWTVHAHPEIGMLCLPSSDPEAFDLRCCVITKSALQLVGGFELDASLEDSVQDFLARVRQAGLSIEATRDWCPEFYESNADSVLRSLEHVQPQRLTRVQERFVPCAAEPGYQPDTGAVTIADLSGPALLTYPDWSDIDSLKTWLSQVSVGTEWRILLRCAPGEGEGHLLILNEMLALMPQHQETSFQLVDAMLAPEREGGLLVAVDAVYIDRSSPDAGLWIRRCLDTGCRLVTDVNMLNRLLTSGSSEMSSVGDTQDPA